MSTQQDSSHQRSSSRRRRPDADQLVNTALEAGLSVWMDPAEVSHASLNVRGRERHFAVKSDAFAREFRRLYLGEGGPHPGPHALAEAVDCLDALALDGPVHPTGVRLTQEGSAIYLDLADGCGRVVCIVDGAWEVVTHPPIKFLRPSHARPLPVPERGGSLDPFRDLFDIVDDDLWTMIVGWLVAAAHPGGPYPVLAIHGEAGTGKTTLARLIKAIIDPSLAPLTRPPRSERDLQVIASRTWVLALNNVSSIRPWLSDALASLATEGGYSTRRLYSDADETHFACRRPIILNGIPDIVGRGDLADRTYRVGLPRLRSRRTEQDLLAQFVEGHPAYLGGLLDAVACAQRRHAVREGGAMDLPRMADAAIWIQAAAPALGWEAGRFTEASTRLRHCMSADLVATDPVGIALCSIAQDLDEPSEWSAGDLLARVMGSLGSYRIELPRSPRGLVNSLRRLMPDLKHLGVRIDDVGLHSRLRVRMWRIHPWRRQDCRADIEGSHPSHLPNEGCPDPADRINEHHVGTGASLRPKPFLFRGAKGASDARDAGGESGEIGELKQ